MAEKIKSDLSRAEIIVGGLVQGVGFRYFVLRTAMKLNVNGYAKNLYSGEVLAVVEGEKIKIMELFEQMKLGPSHSYVKTFSIMWTTYNAEFSSFEIR
ncbi:MAG: acylphosphatase [Ignavibacteria bacterium CG_4_8_14_3_um_filter_37_9]|nr:acylphosphatase [Ignavibacteria bacterium]PIX00230.1 MAG: acylphosphatase [Ignavibacteria bacterium CG_4_8_14_3_um_filter_37_9]PJC60177.1 MAG: acylphosphatase [Ignavibacteria bacterium CG_4_9_14_0_2_um_filter_37_13]